MLTHVWVVRTSDEFQGGLVAIYDTKRGAELAVMDRLNARDRKGKLLGLTAWFRKVPIFGENGFLRGT